MTNEKLDPRVQAIVSAMTMPPEALDALTLPEIRQYNREFGGMAGVSTPVKKVEDIEIAGSSGAIPLRIYTPKLDGPLPILMFFHGGGWVGGDVGGYDITCRQLAAATSSVVVSVDYRLAPEHKFPSGLNDCYDATKWAWQNADSISGDQKRLSVCGDSAGGALAAAVCLMAKSKNGPPVVCQVLIYPALDATMSTKSHEAFGDGYLLSHHLMEKFIGYYLTEGTNKKDPMISPLFADDIKGLPQACIITAEFDPLRDEGEAYGAKLFRAGVKVEHKRYSGMIHGFISLAGRFAEGADAISFIASSLNKAYSPTQS